MKYTIFLLAFFTVLPQSTFAAPKNIQDFGYAFLHFLNGTVVSFLLSLALIIFIYNVIRYYIVDKDSAQKQTVARQYMLLSISAFVLILSIWGIVNLLVAGTGLGRSSFICPDTLPAADCIKFMNR